MIRIRRKTTSLRATVADQIKRSPVVHGSDYGIPLTVLIRYEETPDCVWELWWRPGHTWYANRMTGNAYQESELLLAEINEEKRGRLGLPTRTLKEGGRLSKHLIMEHEEAINEWFGGDVAELVHTRRTLILERQE